MTKVWMIRHGKPAAVWGGDDDDPGLDEVGRAQAEAAALALLALPNGPRRVVSSPLRRCRETAQPFADALGVILEIDPAVGEIPTPRDMDPAVRPTWLRVAMAGAWRDIVGDLNYEDWRRGVASALARHAGAAVFSHFVALNAAVSLARGDDRVMGYRPDHASISTFDTTSAGLVLLEAGPEASTSVL